MKTVSLIAIVLLCSLVSPVYAFSDDFEDGAINTALWDAGGSKGGQACGNGGGQWYNKEIVAADGYLQARATTPASYGL